MPREPHARVKRRLKAQYETLCEIASTRDPGKVYRVSRRIQDGRITCSCPDWIFRGNAAGNHCKHIDAALGITANAQPLAIKFQAAAPTVEEAVTKMVEAIAQIQQQTARGTTMPRAHPSAPTIVAAERVILHERVYARFTVLDL